MSTGPIISPQRVPQLLVLWEPRWRGWLGAIAILGLRAVPSALGAGVRNFPLTELRGGTSVRAVFSSFLAHLGAGLLVLHLPIWLGRSIYKTQPESRTSYEVQKIDLSSYLPNLRPAGPGGKPGRGTRPDRPPARGSTAVDLRLTVVSNPQMPDNFRQTIIQPSSPPELRIPFELRLPNMIIPGNGQQPKSPKPPRLAVTAPRLEEGKTTRLANASDTPPAPPQLALAPSAPSFPFPKLAVPAPPPPPPREPPGAASTGRDAHAQGTAGNALEETGLIALSVDPARFSEVLALPPGNRYGSFSISSFGGQPGSPGGVPGGDPNGGTGGFGTGGDGSTGTGTGENGGGGGAAKAAGEESLSISGGEGAPSGLEGMNKGGGGVLASPSIFSRVYAVVSPVQLRRNTMLVSAGPVGGGGLRVYGVLRGGKIYTSYLPMPGKNWVLQYCEEKKPASAGEPGVRNQVARLESGLVPPWPEQKFDFHRPPIPPEKAQHMIILHGKILPDGSVAGLSILQGVHAEADQAALAAFQQWKFRPALREAQPRTVEILVGIPAVVPAVSSTDPRLSETHVTVPPPHNPPQP